MRPVFIKVVCYIALTQSRFMRSLFYLEQVLQKEMEVGFRERPFISNCHITPNNMQRILRLVNCALQPFTNALKHKNTPKAKRQVAPQSFVWLIEVIQYCLLPVPINFALTCEIKFSLKQVVSCC